MMFSWNLVSLAVVFNAASVVMSVPVVSGSAAASTGSTDPITSTVLPTAPLTTITVAPTGSIPATSSLPASSGPVTSSFPASSTFATTTTVTPPSTSVPPTSTPVPSVQINPNVNIAKCLDVKGGVFANGTPVQIFDCNHTPAQQWVITPGEGHVQLANTTFCLDVGATPALGTGMKIWECFANLPAQDWFYTADKRIALTNQGLCLDLTDGDLTNGRQTQIWTCTDNNTNQVWSTSMATVPPPPVSTA